MKTNNSKKNAIVLGGGGFIGGHLGKRLLNDGYHVRIADIKNHEFWNHEEICNEFIKCDLTDPKSVELVISEGCDEVYQLATDMGGAGYIFTGENDANVMHSSSLINLNVAKECVVKKVKKVFYSSSACMYPEYNQLDPDNPNCEESSAYPANPDSEYGWEKLFSERLYLTYNKNFNIPIRIARYHNIYGPEGTYDGGREKVPAAICRKVAVSDKKDTIEVWGDGKQTRSFLYIDECIKATKLLTRSDHTGPINIGSEEMVSINELVDIVASVAKKDIDIKHIDGPLGVRGRNSDNTLIRKLLDWYYTMSLESGISNTYEWISEKVN